MYFFSHGDIDSMWVSGVERNWWSDWRECHLESFYCSLHCGRQLHNRRCMWQKVGVSEVEKPRILKVGLEPSSFIEVYAYVSRMQYWEIIKGLFYTARTSIAHKCAISRFRRDCFTVTKSALQLLQRDRATHGVSGNLVNCCTAVSG